MIRWTKIGGGNSGREGDWKFWEEFPLATAGLAVQRLSTKRYSYEVVRKEMLRTCIPHDNKYGSWENPAWLMNRDDLKWVKDRLSGGE